MRTIPMQNESQKPNPYLVQKIMTASPEQLIAYIYDAAIVACGRENMLKASEAVQELINALDFNQKALAASFFKMYRCIMEQIHKGNFNEAKELLTELRQTWSEAMKVT